MWKQQHLEHVARTSLKGRKLIVVTFRAPFIHQYRDGGIDCIEPAGGVTAALKPVVSALRGTWIAVGTGSADRATASPRGRLSVPPGRPTFTLRRVFLPETLQQGHYEGASNQMLWPMCHQVYQRPLFDSGNWDAYRAVNRIVADAVLEEAAGQPAVVFIQDYQFALLPRMLKEANSNLTVGQFWHIPFPGYEVLRTLPWAGEFIDGLLGNDVLGFHIPRYAENFCDGAAQCSAPEIRRFGRTIWSGQQPTRICDAPVGIDFEGHATMAASTDVDAAMSMWRARLGSATHIGLGIDRLDYTKGIPERIQALATLFDSDPSLKGKLTFVQVGVPSRSAIAEYAGLDQRIAAEIAAVNARHGTADWTPIVLERRNLPQHEMMALHRLANFCMVTPLHDGMNLVAREFIASRNDGDGVLILSRFAGAAGELGSSLLVNPFCQAELVEAMETALRLPEAERRERMQLARAAVAENDIFRWAGSLLAEFGRKTWAPRHSGQPVEPSVTRAIVA